MISQTDSPNSQDARSISPRKRFGEAIARAQTCDQWNSHISSQELVSFPKKNDSSGAMLKKSRRRPFRDHFRTRDRETVYSAVARSIRVRNSHRNLITAAQWPTAVRNSDISSDSRRRERASARARDWEKRVGRSGIAERRPPPTHRTVTVKRITHIAKERRNKRKTEKCRAHTREIEEAKKENVS